jgi:hypothetical protein
MSSSDSDAPKMVKNKKADKNSKAAKNPEKSAVNGGDYQIKPAKGGPSLDTSTWPLLLKVR